MINIVIIDDHALFRAGLRHLIDSRPGMTVAGEAGCGAEAVPLVSELRPEVALLDLELPDVEGIELISRISSVSPRTAVIVLTMYTSEDLAERAMQAGAMGYLVKGIEPGELPPAIENAAAGRIHITPSVRDRMLSLRYGRQQDGSPSSILSEREMQVLIHLANGRKIRAIAETLSLSQSTIKTHKKHIHEKLGLDTISDLVRYAIRHRLISG